MDKTPTQPSRLRRALRAVGRGLRRIGPEFRPWKSEAHLFALAALSGLILRLSFPRIDLIFFAAIGLVPFLWALPKARSGKQAFYLGWVFGAVYYYTQLFWLNVLIPYFALIPVAIVGLGIYLGLFRGLFALLVWWAGPKSRLSFLVAATAWVAVDYLQAIGDMGFPWGYLGHHLWLTPSLIQLSAWTGVFGLTLIVFWINHLLADTIRFARREDGAPPPAQLVGRAVIFAGFCFLVWLAAVDSRMATQREDFHTDERATVGIVQPNIPQRLKYRSYAYDTPEAERRRLQDDILVKTFQISRELQQGPLEERCDLIVWPETAVTYDFFSLIPAYWTVFNDMATTRLQTTILFGADNIEVLKDGELILPDRFNPDHYNRNPDAYRFVPYVSAWLAEPGTGLSRTIYNKMHLVPFAEGVPFVQHIRPLSALISAVSGMQPYTPGAEHEVFELKDPLSREPILHFGPLICYESCYPRLSNAMVRRGAQALIMITNDAWYERTAGPRQHQLQAVFRAVETRRWMVRCANHGISCFISPQGKILDETELATEATLKRDIRGARALTFYARFGDVFAWIMVLAAAALVAAERLRR